MSHSEQHEAELPNCSSGIPGLDDILVGGLPIEHMYLVRGGTDTGKTTLGLQFLHEETIREFKLVRGAGLVVGPPLTGFRGIMTGVPSYIGKASAILDEQRHG